MSSTPFGDVACLLLAAALCCAAPPAQAQQAETDENQTSDEGANRSPMEEPRDSLTYDEARKLVLTFSKHVDDETYDEASRLATDTFGTYWCRAAIEADDAPKAKRIALMLRGTLTLIARKNNEPIRAARCALESLEVTSSTAQEAAVLLELAESVEALNDIQMTAFYQEDIFGAEKEWVTRTFAIWPKSADKAKARAAIADAFRNIALELHPTPAVAKALKSAGALEEDTLQRLVAAHLPSALAVQGPFGSLDQAKKKLRGPDGGKPRNVQVGGQEARRGEDVADTLRVVGKCAVTIFALVGVDGKYWAAPVLAKFPTGGEGCDEDEGKWRVSTPTWVDVDEDVAPVARYRVTTEAGGSSSDHDVYCQAAGSKMACVDFELKKSAPGPREVTRGAEVSVAANGTFTIGKAHGPAHLTKAVEGLQGKSPAEVHAAAESLLSRLLEGYPSP